MSNWARPPVNEIVWRRNRAILPEEGKTTSETIISLVGRGSLAAADPTTELL